jgi:hypothetical protein
LCNCEVKNDVLFHIPWLYHADDYGKVGENEEWRPEHDMESEGKGEEDESDQEYND